MQAKFSTSQLRQVLQHDLSVAQHSSVYVAFSGGLDSHVLLHALSCLAADYPFTLYAIHVDHSIQTMSADWAGHCQLICDDLGIPLITRKVTVDALKGQSLEAMARDARYSALAEALPVNGICMTAQHLNDQAETVVLQLLRGAGMHGMAAMPATKAFAAGHMLRPLLGYTRASLHEYASTEGLSWLEDPSNQDHRFDRNYLRNKILPALRARWPGMDKSFSRSASHAASAVSLLDEIGQSDLVRCQAADNHYFPPAIASLRADILAELSPVHQKNALRCWVRMNGLTVPGDERLQALIRLLEESTGKGAVDWPAGAFRLYNNLLWLCDSPDLILPGDEVLLWSPDRPLQLCKPELKLQATKLVGEGVALSALKGSELQVRFRQGGEVCKMPGEHGSKTLKKLLQDLAVPPWLRASLPLIYLHGELIAVSCLWSSPHYLPSVDEEGYLFSIHHRIH